MTTTNGYVFQVAQAQGMVSVQVDCTLDDAVEIMQVHANDTSQTLNQVATAVLSRRDLYQRPTRRHSAMATMDSTSTSRVRRLMDAAHLAREVLRVVPVLPSGTVTFLFTDLEGSTRGSSATCRGRGRVLPSPFPDQIGSLSEFVGTREGALGSGKERPVQDALAAEATSSRVGDLAAPLIR